MGVDEVNVLEFVGASRKELLQQGWFRSLTLALTSTLSMSVMGSAVLPLAAIIADTGIVVGFTTAFVMAAVNVYTSKLLIKQARVTGAWDYESLGNLVKGYWWQKFVEISNWILLFGTMVGSISQLGEAGSEAVRMLWCGDPPSWLLGPTLPDGRDTGRLLMVLYVLVFVAPWSLASSIKELEFVGFLGYPIVLWITFSIVGRCIQQGFPAITNGSLPIVGFTGLSNVASTISCWAFAFYLQPVLFPFYSELPPGNVGQHAAGIAVNSVLCGTAFVPYVLIGFFGAALWGPDALETGNVLQNDIYGEFVDGEASCPSSKQGALNICMTVYLAITLVGIEYALDHTVNTWVDQIRDIKCMRWIPVRGKGQRGHLRDVVVSWTNLALSTLAATFSTSSSTALTITGATGVLFVSYVIPIVNHYILLFNRAAVQLDPEVLRRVKRESSAFLPVGLHLDEEVGPALEPASSSALTAASCSRGKGDCLFQSVDAHMQVDSDGEEAPVVNAFYAPHFAAPDAYRDPEDGPLMFWLLRIVVPAVVLLFGCLTSVCTLMGVMEEFEAEAAGGQR